MSCSNLSMSWLNAARLRSLAVKARKVSSSSEETLICNREVHWTKKCTGHKKDSETMIYTRLASSSKQIKEGYLINAISSKSHEINLQPSPPFLRSVHNHPLHAALGTWLCQEANPRAQSVASCQFLAQSGGTAAITFGAQE